MTLDETQFQIFANWPMSQAKRVTKGNRNIQNIVSLPVCQFRKVHILSERPSSEATPGQALRLLLENLKLFKTRQGNSCTYINFKLFN